MITYRAAAANCGGFVFFARGRREHLQVVDRNVTTLSSPGKSMDYSRRYSPARLLQPFSHERWRFLAQGCQDPAV